MPTLPSLFGLVWVLQLGMMVLVIVTSVVIVISAVILLVTVMLTMEKVPRVPLSTVVPMG